MRVINLFGGPGAGKSTLAAALFSYAKRRGLNVELVTEYAKDVFWERRDNIFRDQLYMLAKQNRRLLRLAGCVDYAVTDSPLLLGAAYARDVPASFLRLVQDTFNSYSNLNLFLERPPREGFSEIGRNETYEEATALDVKITSLLSGRAWVTVPFGLEPEKVWREYVE